MRSPRIIGVDPGQTKSGAVLLQGKHVLDSVYDENNQILERILTWAATSAVDDLRQVCLCVELTEPRGQILGHALHDTIMFCGELKQILHEPVNLIRLHRPRPCRGMTSRKVRQTLTGDGQASDARVKQVLRDRWGGGSQRKKTDPLYGITGHCWDALAVAVAVGGDE